MGYLAISGLFIPLSLHLIVLTYYGAVIVGLRVFYQFGETGPRFCSVTTKTCRKDLIIWLT